MPPRSRVQATRAATRKITESLPGGGHARHHWKALQKEKGRYFEWDAKRQPKVRKVIEAHVTSGFLKALAMERKDFHATMDQLQRRVAGTAATIAQLVGTFFEIAGSQHPDIVSMRGAIVRTNIESALYSMFRNKQVFMHAAGNIFTAEGLKSLILQVQWRDGGRAAREMLAVLDTGKARTVERLLSGEAMKMLVKTVAPSSVHRVRDLAIGGFKYCDGAVLLQLKNGKALLLLSEEYKALNSGGMNPQQSIRNVRLFNGDIKPTMKLRFFDAYGKQVTKNVGDLLLNCDTVGFDQMGIKAASVTELKHQITKISKAVRERQKLVYGDTLRINSDANSIFFLYKLNYPSVLVKAMIIDAFYAMPPR